MIAENRTRLARIRVRFRRSLGRFVLRLPGGGFLRLALRARRSGELFDGGWYLQSYPDVAASGMSPLLHYLGPGIREGRFPTKRHAQAWAWTDLFGEG